MKNTHENINAVIVDMKDAKILDTKKVSDKWHTFGELCFNSDFVVLENMKPMIFEEYGNIKGELVYLEVHKAPLYDSLGQLIGTIGSGRDITAQVMLEKQNEKLAYYDQLTQLANRQKFFLDISVHSPPP